MKSYGPRAKPAPAAWLAAKAAAAGDGGAEAPLPKIHPVPAGDGGAEAPLPKIHPVPAGDGGAEVSLPKTHAVPHGDGGAEVPLPEIHPVPHCDDDNEKGQGKGKGHPMRGKPSSEAEGQRRPFSTTSSEPSVSC